MAPHLLAVHDRRDGSRLWTFPRQYDEAWGGTFDVVAADRERVVVANGGYLVETDGRPIAPTTFYVLDARTGDEVSRFEAADPRFSFSDFALTGSTLIYAEGASIIARQLEDGGVRWEKAFDVADTFEGIALRVSEDPLTVFAADFATLTALDAGTGTERWSSSNVFLEVSTDGTTLLRRNDGEFRTLDGVATSDGRPRWSRNAPQVVVTPPYTDLSVATSGGRIAMTARCDDG